MKVIVKTRIHGHCASEDRYAYKYFGLSFAPFEGLTITHKTRKGETDDIIIKEVIWDTEKQCFICYQPSDTEIIDAISHKQTARPMSEIIDEYIEADWLIEPID